MTQVPVLFSPEAGVPTALDGDSTPAAQYQASPCAAETEAGGGEMTEHDCQDPLDAGPPEDWVPQFAEGEGRHRQPRPHLITMEAGRICDARIVRPTATGGFVVQLPGCRALLPHGELAWSAAQADRMAHSLSRQDVLRVVVREIKHHEDDGRLVVIVGHRELQPHPWDVTHEQFPVGEQTRGLLFRFIPGGALLELPGGINGFLPDMEMSWTHCGCRVSDWFDLGDEVPVAVISRDPQIRRMRFSHRETLPNPWRTIATDYPPGKVVESEIVHILKTGLVVRLDNGVLAFVPRETIPFRFKPTAGDCLQVVIVEVHPAEQEVLVEIAAFASRPAPETTTAPPPAGPSAMASVPSSAPAPAAAAIAPGQVHDAFVLGVSAKGDVKVRLSSGQLAHLPADQLAWSRAERERLLDAFKAGDPLRVIVKRVPARTGFEHLPTVGHKDLLPQPWEGELARFPVGTVTEARVARIDPQSATLELDCGLLGRLAQAEVSWSPRKVRIDEVFKVGDRVPVAVIGHLESERRLVLSHRQSQPDPWAAVEAELPAGTQVIGKCLRYTPEGVLFRLDREREALLPNGCVFDFLEVQPGVECELVVTSVDATRRRISVEMAELDEEEE